MRISVLQYLRMRTLDILKNINQIDQKKLYKFFLVYKKLMKVFFRIKLGGAFRNVNRQPGFHIFNGNPVYVQMPGGFVREGFLFNRNDGPIPSWVNPPHESNTDQRVFVRISNEHSLTASLHLPALPVHDPEVHEFRAFIPFPYNLTLTAHLEPYNYELHFSSTPRIFVRIPSPDNPIYTGLLEVLDRPRPRWIP